jgi:hypothetical protein
VNDGVEGHVKVLLGASLSRTVLETEGRCNADCCISRLEFFDTSQKTLICLFMMYCDGLYGGYTLIWCYLEFGFLFISPISCEGKIETLCLTACFVFETYLLIYLLHGAEFC